MYNSSLRLLIRIALFGAILLATLMAALIVFLSQFRLDDYRTSLEDKLSAALHQPVHIDAISFTFNRGLALDLGGVRVGPAEHSLVQLPRLTATLELLPLIERQLQLREVRIQQPTFNLRLPFPERPPRGTSQQLFKTLGISILTIHDASLRITQDVREELPRTLNINRLQAVLRNWQPGTSGQLVVTGKFNDRQSGFLLESRLPGSLDPAVWRRENLQTHVQVTGVKPSDLPAPVAPSLPEKLQLDVSLQGIPAEGAQWNARLQDAAGRKQVVTLSGSWRSTREQESLNNITGQLFQIPLQGETHYIRQSDQHVLAGRISAAALSLQPDILQKWDIPGARHLRSGQLDRLNLVIERRWNPAEGIPTLPRIALEIELSGLTWASAQRFQISELVADLALIDGTLAINRGQLVSSGRPISVSGKISSLFREPRLALQLTTTRDSAELIKLYNLPLREKVSGPVHGRLTLTGRPGEPAFDLLLELDQTRWQMAPYFQKSAAGPLRLTASGILRSRAVEARRFQLDLASARISGVADYHRTADGQLVDISVESIPLKALQTFSPLLAKHRLSGDISTRFRWQPSGWRAELDLAGVGAALPGPVADLRQASGQVQLDPGGLQFESLNAVFGQSRFSLTGILSSWRDPRFSLELTGDRVRARDLIFPNPDLIFEHLEGRLRINRERVGFDALEVVLDDHTQATVNGEVVNFRHPRVNLAIDAEQVKVLDIIQLFNSPVKEARSPQPDAEPEVTIQARAERGTLGGLQFSDAVGVIHNRQGLLRIEPLRFRSGAGWCRGRIIFDPDQRKYPLTISAHLEDLDASVLHHDLFNRQGLITGSLRGDLYLEGDPHPDTFWQSARGGVHVQVREGTLRKFHGLAKVFSLLNVSQIFAGQLPDMDKEGMPFNLLEGSLRIAEGRMHTEDLRIHSEAMNLSLVGSQGLVDNSLDFTLGIMPLRTVDKVVTSIPLAGWVLGGEDKALLTAYFRIAGTSNKPQVTPIPIDSVSNTVLGIFKRTLSLPGKLVKDIGSIFKKEPEKKKEATTE